MCIDERSLYQYPAHAVAQKQNRPRLDFFSLYSYGLKQFARFANERILITPIYCCRVVLSEKDARFGEVLRQVTAEPEASLGTRRSAPRIPSVVTAILASWIQAMNGDDAGHLVLVGPVNAKVVHTQLVLHCSLQPQHLGPGIAVAEA